MAKVLAQTGTSLADIYDVQGSVAGVDQLISEEVSLTHEMGATIFSERLAGAFERLTTGALLQNITFNITGVVSTLPIYRVLGVYVQTDVAARLTRAQVSLRDPTLGREIPMFIWDTANDIESQIDIIENGAAASVDTALIQANPGGAIPNLGIGVGQRLRVGGEIVLRGLTAGFGAGNVTVTALVHLAFTSVAELSNSRGVPIPGW